MPHDLVNRLGVQGFLKRIDKLDFSILTCKYVNFLQELAKHLASSVYQQLLKENTFLSQSQKLCLDKFQENLKNVVVLQLQNKQSILDGKTLAKQLTEVFLYFFPLLSQKYDQSTNKEDLLTEIQFELGIYISPNAAAAAEESALISD